MPARSLAENPVRHVVPAHPKHILYDEAYDPVTIAWFEALAASPEVDRLLDAAPHQDLVVTLQAFNALFHRLVDTAFVSLRERAEDVVAIADKHRADVLWAGHMTPLPDDGPAAIRTAFGHKLKRNVSLGVIEALICLESAYTYARFDLGLTGETLAATLQRSRQLYASLALLHDEQEKVRLNFLTGTTGHLTYPQVDYPDVIGHAIHIPADKFVVSGPPEARRIKFVSAPVQHITLDSPIKRCPAHRIRGEYNDEMTPLNDILWNLLLTIYRRAGRFA